MTVVPAEAAEVLRVNQRFYDAIETADLDAMHDIWLAGPDGASAQCVHPGWTPLHGRDAVLRSWAMIMASTTYIQFVLTDVRVSVTGDVAMVSCGENMLTGLEDLAGPAGGDGTRTDPVGLAGGRAVASNVFRRTPSGWRMWLHHASPVLVSEAGR